MDFEKLDALLEELLPEMEQDLAALVACPSVEGAAEGIGAPFGGAVQDALQTMLGISSRLGFDIQDLDGYCGTADLPGDGSGSVGILGHVDVVPAVAADWAYPPFTMTKVGEKLYGRGTMDDKGPTLAALYGAHALKRLGFSPRRTIRFIYGCNEETGMKCMKYYKQHAECPDMGFTPDADWPLIVGEKGILHYDLTARWETEPAEVRLLSLDSGIAANVVPASATAVLAAEEDITKVLPAQEGITCRYEDGRCTITAVGTAAHASQPSLGVNALSRLLRYLAKLSFGPSGAYAYVQTMAKLTEDDLAGAALGVALEDDLSRTSNCPTVCHIGPDSGRTTLDMRFCLSHHTDRYLALLEKAARENLLTFEPGMAQEPLYLGKDHPLVPMLLESYREVTGIDSEPLIIGGGTYAKEMPNFMAFGPEPEGQPSRAHQTDEYITESELLEAAKIYARAIWRMAR